METDTRISEIEGFVARGNFHAAYNIALSALHACDREGDKAGVDRFLTVIRDIVNALSARYSGANDD